MKNLTVLFVLSLIFCSFSANLPADSSLAPVSDEQKQKIISFLSSETGYVIDDVLELIKSLLDDSQLQLDDLESSWAVSSVEKQQTIQNITLIIQGLQQTCQDDLDVATTLNDTINKLNDKIIEYQDIISKNENRTQILHDARCQANQNYILGLTKNKKTLALIALLRETVEQFNEQSLLQLGLRKLESISQVLAQMARKNRKFLALIQDIVPNVPDVQERTSEEIGTGYIDNDKGAITVDSFDSQTLQNFQGVKTKLLNILDDLEAGVKAEMLTNQVNELASNENLADFEVSLETENTYYLAAIKNLTIQVNETIDEFITGWSQVEQCQTSYNSWEATLTMAENDLQNATDYYNSKKQQFEDMIDLFTEIFNLYKSEVYSVNDEYKARADDYIDDQVFNTTEDFDARSADQYNNLSGEVNNATYEAAQQNVDSSSSPFSDTLVSNGANGASLIETKLNKPDEHDEFNKRADSLFARIRSLNRNKAF